MNDSAMSARNEIASLETQIAFLNEKFQAIDDSRVPNGAVERSKYVQALDEVMRRLQLVDVYAGGDRANRQLYTRLESAWLDTIHLYSYLGKIEAADARVMFLARGNRTWGAWLASWWYVNISSTL